MTMTKHEFDLRHGAPIQIGGRYLYADGWQAKWDADGSGRFKEPPFDDDELEALRQEYRDTVLAQQMERIRSRGESFEDFARRQGCPYRMVKGRALFKNGATHAGPGTYGTGTEPPTERFARLRLQEQFLRDALAEEERAFNAFRKYAAEAAANATRFSNCNPPPPDSARQLEAGRQRVLTLRGELADVLEQLGQSPDAQALRQTQEMHAKQRSDIETQHGQIMAIQI